MNNLKYGYDSEVAELKSKTLRKVGKLQLISIAVFISSPFVWIWHSWDLAWKIGLTGFILTIILYWLHKIVNDSFDVAAKKIWEENNASTVSNRKKSAFQEKLEKLAKERGYKQEENK